MPLAPDSFPKGVLWAAGAMVAISLISVGGVRLTGTDAWSWDAPFVHTAQKYGATQDASLIWEGHKAGRDIGYCHLEKLHNLEVLPPSGFYISCFPHKIRGASAGWTRAVAIIDDALMTSGRA
jgi:kynurenine formamidase